MQLQAGRGRALVRSCRARTTGHQNLRIRMVTARPDALTRLQAPAGHLPADSCGLFSLQSACSVRYASGMHVRSRQLLDYFRKAAAGGTCARHHSTRCDLIETTAPEWLPLAACSNAPGVSCMPSDARASGRPWATAVALPSHTSRGSSSLSHRCVVCTTADWARACPATRAASCSAADCGRTASTGSGCIGSIMRAPSHYDRSPSE